MSDIPKYANGQIGKLDAKAINKLAAAANRTPESEKLATPNFKRTETISQYPIAALIIGQVDPEDKFIDEEAGEFPFLLGYKWIEVKYSLENGLWAFPTDYQQDLRAYHPRTRNAAYALGISDLGESSNPYGLDVYTPNFTGKVVNLFPQRSFKGQPILTFQPPAEAVTYVARITGYESSSAGQCNLVPSSGFGGAQGNESILLYKLEVGNWSGFDSNGGTPVFTPTDFQGSAGAWGVNMVEFNGESHLGGAITQGSASLSRTPIPVGTYVMAHRMFRNSGNDSKVYGEFDDIYGFTVANSLCVACDGAFANTAEDAVVTRHTSKDMRNASKLERHASDILKEMMK